MWEANLTEASIDIIRAALKRRATKDTSVACFRLRNRHALELLWVVGRRKCFSLEGYVPVASTTTDKFSFFDSCSMEFLPAMRPIVQMAALLHDIGKSNKEFQTFLNDKSKPDKLRHEWFSGLLFAALVHREGGEDAAWLQSLQKETIDLQNLPARITPSEKHPFQNLPPLASILLWLIISHHRLPFLWESQRASDGGDNGYISMERLDHPPTFSEMLSGVRECWGYQKNHAQNKISIPSFQLDALEQSKPYMDALRSTAKELERQLPLIEKLTELPAFRLVLIYCRAALMLGDYTFSSRHPDSYAEPKPRQENIPYANSYPYFTKNGEKERAVNQTLVEHLLGVAKAARKSITFSHFIDKGNRVYDNRFLRHRSPHAFQWQDRAADKFKNACGAEDALPSIPPAGFIVNMASTGKGKTIANAKIMRALSKDQSLRFSVLFNLKSLTLQTGDVYCKDLGFAEDDCTVSIGSPALKELHERDSARSTNEDWWQDSSLFPSKCEFYPAWLNEEDSNEEDETSSKLSNDHSPLAVLFQDNSEMQKEYRARLETPIFIAPIDYMIPATDAFIGGRYLLPLFRMMSSDVILDEVDDYSPEDLLAVSRLIHLAGCFGRNVILSSATMPPSLVRGMAKAYCKGYETYQSFFQTNRPLVLGWCDEFHSSAIRVPDGSSKSLQQFAEEHDIFVKKRVKELLSQPILRKAMIWTVRQEALKNHDCRAYLQGYLDACLHLHDYHGIPYKDTGKRWSVGCIRVSRITFSASLMYFLAHAELPEDTEIRLLLYHSNQTVLLRHEEEAYLDTVLHRKPKAGKKELPNSPDMCEIIEASKAKNILFILIATPVEEVGRDHDFDWAVIEPSSFRSIIQMAGRILRHRRLYGDLDVPNIAIMEYSQKEFDEPNSGKPVFQRPGFEIDRSHLLAIHDAKELIAEPLLDKIDSTPRIKEPEVIDDKRSFVGLEHRVMKEFAGEKEHIVDDIDGWASSDSFLFLSGFVQYRHMFRGHDNPRQMDIYRKHIAHTVDSYEFCSIENESYAPISRRAIEGDPWTEVPSERLWLSRDFQASLERLANEKLENGSLSVSSPTDELTEEDWWKLERKYGMVPSWWDYEDSYNHASNDMGIFYADKKTIRAWFRLKGARKI